MWGQYAVLGDELAEHLVSKGFELCYTKQGKHIRVYYFTDIEAIHIEIENYINT